MAKWLREMEKPVAYKWKNTTLKFFYSQQALFKDLHVARPWKQRKTQDNFCSEPSGNLIKLDPVPESWMLTLYHRCCKSKVYTAIVTIDDPQKLAKFHEFIIYNFSEISVRQVYLDVIFFRRKNFSFVWQQLLIHINLKYDMFRKFEQKFDQVFVRNF